MFVPNNELLIAWHKRLQNIVGCWCRCVLHILKRHRLKTDFNKQIVATFFLWWLLFSESDEDFSALNSYTTTTTATTAGKK
jgi:hypothetical protein